MPRILTPAWSGALALHTIASAPFAWPASSLVGEPGGIGIPNPSGCISAPELPPPWIILLASYTWAEAPLPCENSDLQPLAACARVDLAWDPCSTGDADKACKNTRANQTQIPWLDLALTPFLSTRKQPKQSCPAVCQPLYRAVLLSSCWRALCWSIKFRKRSHPFQWKTRPCKPWKLISHSPKYAFQSLTCSKNLNMGGISAKQEGSED